MAQANYTPIQLYRSTTASAVPTSGNLADGELAINTADGKLFYKNSGGAVRLLSIGYGSSTVTPTNGGVQYGTGSALALTAAGSSGQILRSNGAAAPTWENLSALGVSTISFGTTGLTPNSATSGAVTVAGTLATTNGGTGLTSFTANQVFYASSTSAVAQSSNLLYSGTDLTVYGITVGRGAGAVSTNTAVGASALNNNTTGSYNQAVGVEALRYNTDGIANTALGAQAAITNTSGGRLVALGNSALYANTTGSYNTAVGVESLRSNTTASNNTAVGYQAGYSNVTGTRNLFQGYQAAYYNTTGNDNTALGYGAYGWNTGAASATGSNNTAVGSQALAANTTASNNTAVGYQAGYSNTTGTQHVAVGTQALYSTTTSNNNIAVGYRALYANTTGGENVAIGYGSLDANTTATGNTGVGHDTLGANTTGAANVAVGYHALLSNTTASNNTAVGYQAGYLNTVGTGNVYFGWLAGYAATSSTNTFIGTQSGYNNTTGERNTYIGNSVGFNATTGSNNTFIGLSATSASGAAMTTGSKNTIIGGYNGNQGGLDIRTANNYIVLSDGDGNPLVATYANGTVALQGAVPNNGTGITFPATQSASSNANTLDDYERGTWTPSVGGTATYTVQEGFYTKIGNQVTATGKIQINSIGTGSQTSISGLPFTSLSPSSGTYGTGSVGYFASLASAVYYINAYVPNGTAVVAFNNLTSLASTANNAPNTLTNSTRIDFCVTYFV